jgi:hypothetical protein
MQQVHDILVGILSAARSLEEKRLAFTEQMILFTGDSAELEDALSNYRAERKVQSEALRSIVQEALSDLKGILTIEQGEILRGALSDVANIGIAHRQLGIMEYGTLEMQRENRRLDSTDRNVASTPLQEPEQEREQESEESLTWLEQMKTCHPRLAEKMADRWASKSSESFEEKFGGRPLDLQELDSKKMILGRADGGRLLALLDQVVEILDTKLQSLQ